MTATSAPRPRFRLVRAVVRRGRCGKPTAVVGLTAATVEQGRESHGRAKATAPRPLLLQHIADMPYDLRQVVRAYPPRIVKRDARIGDAAHYRNEWHGCGTGSSDDELFSQPGGPFLSSSPDAVAPVEIHDPPVIGTLELQADGTAVGNGFVFAGERT